VQYFVIEKSLLQTKPRFVYAVWKQGQQPSSKKVYAWKDAQIQAAVAFQRLTPQDSRSEMRVAFVKQCIGNRNVEDSFKIMLETVGLTLRQFELCI
jgi:hypothetical protein